MPLRIQALLQSMWVPGLVVLLSLSLAGPASAQLGIAAKAGTAGIGADVGLGLSGPLSLRLGVGLTDLVSFDNQFEVEDLTYTLTLPSRFLMVGADLNLLGPLNLSGGMLWREGDLAVETEVFGATEIGGVTYTESGRISGMLEMKPSSPYVALSLGGLARRGVGIFVMAGAVLSGEPTVRLSADGPITQVPGFGDSLEVARQEAQDQIPEWLTVWPLVQVGFRIGF
jgi:hypothetical protein